MLRKLSVDRRALDDAGRRLTDYQIALYQIGFRSHDLNANRVASNTEIPQPLIIKTFVVHIRIIKMTAEDCATVLEQFIHDGR